MDAEDGKGAEMGAAAPIPAAMAELLHEVAMAGRGDRWQMGGRGGRQRRVG
jgi:hypothetical protein